MQLRKFPSVSTAAVSTGTIGVSDANASSQTSDKKGFIVKAGEARSGVHTPFQGVNPNDVKISGKDTGGQLAVLSTLAHRKLAHPCTYIFTRTKYFTLSRVSTVFS
jgi:hypothetical protein